MALQRALRARRSDGSEFSAEIGLGALKRDGKPMFAAAIRDVTERRRVEDRLRELLEAALDAIIIVDSDGQIVACNAMATSVFGYERDELVGGPMAMLVPKAHRASHSTLRRRYFDDPKARPMGDGPTLSAERKNGEQFPAEISLSPMKSEEGLLTIAAVRDVTHKQKMEQQVVQSERMAALGRLATAVAHEINNPLTYVISSLDFLAEELREPLGLVADDRVEEFTEVIGEALEGSERIRRVVQGLRHFSRADNERMEPVSLRHVLEVTCEVAKNEIRHRARLVESYGEVPPIMANESRLSQVFLNLLVNAAHSFPSGDAAANEIVVKTESVGDRVLVSVEDNGAGIPSNTLAHVFDPFGTTSSVKVGSGLSLAICRNVIEGLGGEIRVSSTEGEGSVFTVELKAARAGQAVAPRQSSPPRRARVLIIDDDEPVASAVQRLIGKWHDVEICHSAATALQVIEHTPLDLILCDGMLPGTDTADLHEQIRVAKPRLAASMIYVTGGVFSDDSKSFLASIRNRCLTKPVNRRTLLDAIDDALGAG